MQRMYAAKEATKARQQSSDTSNSTGTKQGSDKTQQHTHTKIKKGYFSTEGKLVEKTGKLIEGLGSGKALNGSKLRAVKQLAAEPQAQVHNCKNNTKKPQK